MSIVSVIIPIYNAEKYLRRCLDSVKSQTVKDFECLMIDDGSSDCSVGICEEYSRSDARFKLFVQNNSGPSGARNTGLDNAISDWVTFVDADDYVSENYLANFLDNNASDVRTQVIQGYYCEGFNGIDDDTLYPSIKYDRTIVTHNSGSRYVSENNLLYNWGVWCKVFSREILNKYGLRFDLNLKCGEDGLFWHNYLCHVDRILYISEQGYTYFCPRNHMSVSRGINNNLPGPDGLMSLAKTYRKITPVLVQKFSLDCTSRQLLNRLYIINYFKLLLRVRLNEKQLKELERIKPKYSMLPSDARRIAFFLINFFPIRFINRIATKESINASCDI